MKEGLVFKLHKTGRMLKQGPFVWCDICGWGNTIIGDADDTIHFCHRHKANEVGKFWVGELPGYFELNRNEP